MDCSQKTKDWLVSFLCLLGSALSFYYLYLDFQDFSKKQGHVIGKISLLENQVRRKVKNSFLWNSLSENSDLYHQDSLTTGNNSHASIRLNDEVVLELEENSLVVLSSNKENSYEFKQGSFIIRKPSGDEKLEVSSKGETTKVELQLKLQSPAPNARLYISVGNKKTVKFEWNEKLKSSTYFQISSNRKFNKSLTEVQNVTDGVSLEKELVAGTYYWKLQGQGEQSDLRKLEIIEAIPFAMLYPINQTTLNFVGNQAKVKIEWSITNPNISQGKHFLEISHDETFSKPITKEIDNPLSGNLYVDLEQGEWFYRIRSTYSDINVETEIRKITINKIEKNELSLLEPNDGQVLELGQTVNIKFKSTVSESENSLSLASQDGKFKFNEKLKSNEYQWKATEVGTYEWKITSLDAESVIFKFSVLDSKKLLLKTPANNEVILFKKEIPEFEFSWAEEAGEEYELEWSRELSLRTVLGSIKTSEAKIKSSQMKLDKGNYYWRIRSLSKEGKTAKISSVYHFKVDTIPLLSAPTELSPKDLTVWNVVTEGKDPIFTWTEVKEALGYEVTCFQKGKEVTKYKTEKTELLFTKVKEGKYTWLVRAVDELGRSGEASEMLNIEIQAPKLSAPRTISTEVE